MNFKKRFFELFIIIVLVLISLELSIRTFLYKKEDFLFQSNSQYLFYKENMKKLHHLRDVVGNNKVFKNPEKFLFTKIIDNKENKKLILFQGDSRTRQLDEFQKSNLILKGTSYNLINGGSTSFSPSMMSVQFDILFKEYNYKPNIIVALIDPTDLGDELCRYKNNIVIVDEHIKKIEPTHSKNQYYFYQNLFLMSEIKFFQGPKILKSHKIIKHYLKYNLGSKKGPCRYREIQNYLMNIKKDEIEYFNKILNLYLKNLIKNEFVNKVYLVLYPHVQHLEYEKFKILYKYKLNEIISVNLDRNKDKVEIIDYYNNDIFNDYKKNYNKIFIENDNASHLTSKGIEVFYGNIFKDIKF